MKNMNKSIVMLQPIKYVCYCDTIMNCCRQLAHPSRLMIACVLALLKSPIISMHLCRSCGVYSLAARKTSAAANLLEGSALSKAARAVARLRAMLTGVGTGGDYCRAPNSAMLPFK